MPTIRTVLIHPEAPVRLVYLLLTRAFLKQNNLDSRPCKSKTKIHVGTKLYTQPLILFRHDHPDRIFEETWRDTQRRPSDDVFVDLPGYTLPISRWTSANQDDKLLNHLLLLFWAWDTVCNRIIDRTIFEEDLKKLDPKTTSAPWELRFCSPFLVNALLAVSCVCRLFHTHSMVRLPD